MSGRSKVLAWVAGATAMGFCLAHSANAAGDPAAGEKKFYTCYGCHGVENYKNAYPDYSVPELRHQNAAYIVAALHEYKNGDRPHPTMHAQASSLSDQDIEDIAAYLQGDPVKPSSSPATPPALFEGGRWPLCLRKGPNSKPAASCRRRSWLAPEGSTLTDFQFGVWRRIDIIP